MSDGVVLRQDVNQLARKPRKAWWLAVCNSWVYGIDMRAIKNTLVTPWKINVDPENDQFIVETSLPTPIWQGLC